MWNSLNGLFGKQFLYLICGEFSMFICEQVNTVNMWTKFPFLNVDQFEQDMCGKGSQ